MLDVNDFIMKQILCIFPNQGDKLSYKNDNVIVKDVNGSIKHQSTCYRLFAIFIIGDLSITTGLIQRAKKYGFSIVLFTTSFKVYHIIGGTVAGNTILNRKQYQYNGLEIAKHIVKNKIENQRSVLKEVRIKSEYQKETIKLLETYVFSLEPSTSIQELMGYEGAASKVYFKAWFDNVLWDGRKPRIKNDMLNALLDIGYTILFNYIEAIVSIYGFDLYVGVLHRCFYMRKSLVCDLVEPFRCIIDKQIKKSINLRQFRQEDFKVINKRYVLKWEKSSEYTMVFLKAILNEKDDIFRYIQAYYRSFMKDLPIEKYPLFLLGGALDDSNKL